MGSAKHATGECRPCAWYWKPNSCANGCANGKDCLHCHLCPETEIKRRKKAKLDSTRIHTVGEEAEVSSDEAPSRAQSSSPKPRALNRSGNRGKSSTPPPPPCANLQEAAAHASTNGDDEDEKGVHSLPHEDLPSSGSALHALGKCKPCAWHWKPGGCTNGKECCHCHLCPAGELKGRRKVKETAMRAGALKPAKETRPSPANSRTMHVLKIFPLL